MAMCCVQGNIPDMTATTAMYLQLQRVYRERADEDVAAVEGHVQRILSSIGRAPGSIPHVSIRTFCKNARNLRCAISTRLKTDMCPIFSAHSFGKVIATRL